VNEVGRFYKTPDGTAGSHLGLRWKGRVRYIVPRERAGQKACWKLFHPGRLEFPLRAQARLAHLLGAIACEENERLAFIRASVGNEVGLSCLRSGAPGPWSKDTILFLDGHHQPLYFVKAGTGEAVNSLLRNEAKWLRTLREHPPLAGHISEAVSQRCCVDLSYVAVRALSGRIEFEFTDAHSDFLRKLHAYSRQNLRLQESNLYRNLRSRQTDLNGLLDDAWSRRLDKALRLIEESFSDRAELFVAAHNDFTPWNIRIDQGIARIFDWEYADYEQLPLFDPLHFALMPMALEKRSTSCIVNCMHATLGKCPEWLGRECCHHDQTQALAYALNLSTLYLTAEQGKPGADFVLESYSRLIDTFFH
jgi:hypothetical protein